MGECVDPKWYWKNVADVARDKPAIQFIPDDTGMGGRYTNIIALGDHGPFGDEERKGEEWDCPVCKDYRFGSEIPRDEICFECWIKSKGVLGTQRANEKMSVLQYWDNVDFELSARAHENDELATENDTVSGGQFLECPNVKPRGDEWDCPRCKRRYDKGFHEIRSVMCAGIW